MTEPREPPIDVVGIGEDGLEGLGAGARTVVESADLLIGGARVLQLVPERVQADRRCWPSPFDLMLGVIRAAKGRVVVLVSGDPTWFSAGALLRDALGREAVRLHLHPSAFQLACARMGWRMQAVETLTAHGRPLGRVIPHLAPGAQLLVLAEDGATARRLARLLSDRGFGASRLSVLAHLGGPEERRIDAAADAWDDAGNVETPDLCVLAVECRLAPGATALPRGPGLPDDVFAHDGKITKREVRAVTLSLLAPRRGEVLWDVGAGCGSIAVEWLRLAPEGRAIGIEPDGDRRAMAARNAEELGAPDLRLVAGRAPDALDGLDAPDAVFLGGGLSEETVARCLSALKPRGRLVANAVTLESEALLTAMAARHGGALTRMAVHRAEPIGVFRGWRPLMSVTQWSLAR